MSVTSLEEFYRQTASIVPENINREIGHFNVFRIDELMARMRENKTMPYNRRAYYKISLIIGRNRAEYADKVIEIKKRALLFATPRIPYNYAPLNNNQSGHFCIFTTDFLMPAKSGVALDELPIFRPGGYPIFEISSDNEKELAAIFLKIHRELSSDYTYKYDLIRNYVLELIHFGQKLQPASSLYSTHNASARVSSLFIELLERQFPIESSQQRLALRTAKDFADRLSVHVNHLNKVLRKTQARQPLT
jgi:AraC family transcriptional activator of pobA